MGVADRSYMRGRTPPSIAFGSSWTLRLLIVLGAVWFAVRGSRAWWGRDLVPYLELSTDGLARGRVWTALTAAFVHVEVWHLAMNALGLWYFGKLVEATLGGTRYVVFVLAAAALSHVPFLVAGFVTDDPTRTIGASGIVMAALVFAALRYPGMPFQLFFLPLKLWQIAVLYVGVDAYGILTSSSPGIDHWTHLGGAAFGLVVHRFGLVPQLRMPRLSKLLPHAGRPPRDPGPYEGGGARAEIDRLLDKINAQGIGSLSESEREFLKRNAARYD